jgi:hypothetical protein
LHTLDVFSRLSHDKHIAILLFASIASTSFTPATTADASLTHATPKDATLEALTGPKL